MRHLCSQNLNDFVNNCVVHKNLHTLLEKLCSLEYSLAELWLEPPDLEDLAEKSSRFFFATVVPTPVVFVFVSWSVEEELCLEGDK